MDPSSPGMSIGDLLYQGEKYLVSRGIEEPSLNSKILLSHALGLEGDDLLSKLNGAAKAESEEAFGGGQDVTASGATLDLKQALFTWGKIPAAIRVARSGRMLAEDELRLYRQTAVRLVTGAFFDVLLAREIDPEVRGGLLLHAKLLYAIGDEKEGVPLLSEAISKGEGGAEALYTYINWMERLGRRQEGTDFIEKLAAEFPDPPDDLLGAMGWLAFLSGDYPKAASKWEKIADQAEAGRYSLYLARIHKNTGELQKAENWSKVGMGSGSEGDRRLAALELADIYTARGRVSAAVGVLEDILKQNPEDFEALNAIGLIEMGKENPKKAGDYFRKATETGEARPEGWNNLGLVLRASGDHKGAEEKYKKALAADPNFAPALKNLAILYDKYMGRFSEAIALYENYLKIRPTDEEAQKWLKASQRQAGGGQ